MTSPTILVIEDNQTEQYVIKQLLDRFDYNCDMVSSGEEALNAVGLVQYAAVLMDVMLPGMDGYECTSQIRRMELELGRRTPIIALTGRSQPEDRAASMAAGMDDYMSKPFHPDDLRKMLLRWVYDPNRPNLKVLQKYPDSDVPHDAIPEEEQKQA